MLRGSPITSSVHCFARKRYSERCAEVPVCRFTESVSAGSENEAIQKLGRSAGLLRVLSKSRRAVGAVSVRLSRPGAASAVGCNLHGAATGEFLARRFARPGYRSNLY